MYDRGMLYKWFPIRQGGKRGRIVGWIEMIWSETLKAWVSIPGATRYREAR